MGSTKVVSILDNDVTLTAGDGPLSHESGVWNLEDGYGGELVIKITNGGTGPTVAAEMQVQVSPDNSNWYNSGGVIKSTLGNGVVSSWPVPISAATKFVKVLSGANTGQDVVIRVEGTEVTALS